VRNISFALTTEQVSQQKKTVTRRHGWRSLKPGALLQPVEKSQGLKRGESVTRIGSAIRVVSVRQEPLEAMLAEPYGTDEATREGFHRMTGAEFVAMFRRHIRDQIGCVTRIEFEYLTGGSGAQSDS
jgi:hypothetical protein